MLSPNKKDWMVLAGTGSFLFFLTNRFQLVFNPTNSWKIHPRKYGESWKISSPAEVGAQIYCVDRLEIGVAWAPVVRHISTLETSNIFLKIHLSKKLMMNFITQNFEATHSFLME